MVPRTAEEAVVVTITTKAMTPTTTLGVQPVVADKTSLDTTTTTMDLEVDLVEVNVSINHQGGTRTSLTVD